MQPSLSRVVAKTLIHQLHLECWTTILSKRKWLPGTHAGTLSLRR
jgi:hypothetical protein